MSRKEKYNRNSRKRKSSEKKLEEEINRYYESLVPLDCEAYVRYYSQLQMCMNRLKHTDLKITKDLDRILETLAFFGESAYHDNYGQVNIDPKWGFASFDDFLHLCSSKNSAVSRMKKYLQNMASIASGPFNLPLNSIEITEQKYTDELDRLESAQDKIARLAELWVSDVQRHALLNIDPYFVKHKGADKIFSGVIDYMQRINFYHKLSLADVSDGIEQCATQTILKRKAQKYNMFRVVMSRFDQHKMRFIRYAIDLYARKKSSSPIYHDETEDKIRAGTLTDEIKFYFGNSAPDMFERVNELRHIEPHSVECIHIGPFFNRHTRSDELGEYLNALLEKGSYILSARKSYLQRADSAPSSILKSRFRRKVDVPVGMDMEKEYFVCDQVSKDILWKVLQDHDVPFGVYTIKKDSNS